MRIREKTFWEKYQPVKNHINKNAGYDGCLFETFGEELKYVQSRKAENVVWTLLDCDGQTIVSSGYHFVNRLGYFVTLKPTLEDAYFRT